MKVNRKASTMGKDKKGSKSPSKKCNKVRYKDEIAAKCALAKIAHSDSSKRYKSEVRAYRCKDCHGYHLTSKNNKKDSK